MQKTYEIEYQYLVTETIRITADNEDEACAQAQEQIAEDNNIEPDDVEITSIEDADGIDDLDEMPTYAEEDLEND